MAAMALIAAALLTGCSMNPIENVRQFFAPRGESHLSSGIRNYEEGRFAEAADNLRDALRAGLSDPNELIANKYLAFIACSHNRERHCRAYFRRMLEIQPNYELSALEVGHPMWGPTFRALKAPQ